MKSDSLQLHIIFFCFLLAALAGVLYRLGFVMPLPAELSLQNIRHAHSHLMFFGWAAAIPLYIMVRELKQKLPGDEAGLTLMNRAIWGMLFFGLLSFPFFLFFGYRPVPLGSASLPFSVILSGLVMTCWYLYIGGYLKVRNKLVEADRNIWFEASLVMLFISSLGAWGVAIVQALDIANPLFGKALTHFFLSCFTEGYVVLSVIGILVKMEHIPPKNYLLAPRKLAGLIVICAPLTFAYGISESLITPGMLAAALLAGLAAGWAVCVACLAMLRTHSILKSILVWPAVLLFGKGLMQLTASVMPAEFLFSDHALRIFYLHVLLLGALTLTAIGYLHRARNLKHNYFTVVASSILVVLVSLLLLTRFWPIAWSGIWVFYTVAGAALLPTIAVAAEWWKLATRPEKIQSKKINYGPN